MKAIAFLADECTETGHQEIRQDTASGKQMNRLLQGDVGSGKTMVAIMCMLIALDNGFQVCLMAPTEILASQHYDTFKAVLAGMDIRVELLTGSTRRNNERRSMPVWRRARKYIDRHAR